MTRLTPSCGKSRRPSGYADRPCSRVTSVSGLVDPVLVAEQRGERTEPPLEGRLAGDTAQLGRALGGDIAAHEPDEEDPGGERFAAVLEGGAGEGGEPPAAAAADPPRDAGAETRAFKVKPISRRPCRNSDPGRRLI